MSILTPIAGAVTKTSSLLLKTLLITGATIGGVLGLKSTTPKVVCPTGFVCNNTTQPTPTPSPNTNTPPPTVNTDPTNTQEPSTTPTPTQNTKKETKKDKKVTCPAGFNCDNTTPENSTTTTTPETTSATTPPENKTETTQNNQPQTTTNPTPATPAQKTVAAEEPTPVYSGATIKKTTQYEDGSIQTIYEVSGDFKEVFSWYQSTLSGGGWTVVTQGTGMLNAKKNSTKFAVKTSSMLKFISYKKPMERWTKIATTKLTK